MMVVSISKHQIVIFYPLPCTFPGVWRSLQIYSLLYQRRSDKLNFLGPTVFTSWNNAAEHRPQKHDQSHRLCDLTADLAFPCPDMAMKSRMMWRWSLNEATQDLEISNGDEIGVRGSRGEIGVGLPQGVASLSLSLCLCVSDHKQVSGPPGAWPASIL